MRIKDESYAVKKTTDASALWTDKGSLLKHLDIELTERCNNNCLHCCINHASNDADARAREMTTAQVKDILQQAADLGCLTLRFTGGEPLLRPDFEELYLHARRLGMKVFVYTNGTLITHHLADLFARVPPLEPIEITVYGMKRESYEAVTRVPGTFAAFWRGMHLLLERRVPFIAKCALLPPNKAEMDAFETFAKSLPAMNRTPSYVILLDLRVRHDSAEINRRIEALRLSPTEAVAVLARWGERYRKDMRAFCSRYTKPPGDALFDCGAGQGSGCVDAYGRFQMCMSLRHPEMTVDVVGATRVVPQTGQVRKLSLRDALAQLAAFRNMRATNPDYLARCVRCFLKVLCDQCPGKSWMEHGTLDTPVEYQCQIAHAQALHLGLLAEGENAWEIQDGRERIKNFVGEQKPSEGS
jgi:MoaA/NifB/PqqE/SkfB family radical SAM enzyme